MDKLIDNVSTHNPATLGNNTAGQNYLNYFMVNGLVQHDIYHADE
ncbi:MAG: hypothetical protein ACYC49_12875 [Ignavibacteriaceae bacterium]